VYKLEKCEVVQFAILPLSGQTNVMIPSKTVLFEKMNYYFFDPTESTLISL